MVTKRRSYPNLLSPQLNGQWLGEYTGDAPGSMVLNFDDRGTHYEGSAFISPHAPNPLIVPTTFAYIRTKDKASTFTFPELQLFAMNPQNNFIGPVDQVLSQLKAAGFDVSTVKLPTKAAVHGKLDNGDLALTWTTNYGLNGAARLLPSRANSLSEYRPRSFTWQKFKKHFSSLADHDFIYRGQSSQRRLRTTFHRTGRADLTRFLTQDIATLHKRLSAKTKHLFRLEIPDENGAFFNLLQHHGYPTPLLDWTHSPYVAAFFAYRGISSSAARSAGPNEKIRIFVFDKKKWHEHFPVIVYTNPPHPHFSVAEFIAIDNERMIPQQAISTATNIDDIETYLRAAETRSGSSYLSIIDLPVRERDLVIRELSVMGITAGSLFPGLDGACEELRERFFQC